MFQFIKQLDNKTPKYKQIVANVINSVEKGDLRKDDQLPSINELSYEYDIARDTVEKAYNELKEKGIINSVKGKGYFIQGLKDSKLRILLIMNKLSAYKKRIYYSFINTLGDKANVDLHIHHYNAGVFSKIISENLGKYHHYVIMPHFYEDTKQVDVMEVLKKIPADELVLLDKNVEGLKGNYLAVYQDFETDVYDGLTSGLPFFEKYKEIVLVFPDDENYPEEIIKGFRRFCIVNKKQYNIIAQVQEMAIKTQTLYLVIEETDLVEIVKRCIDKNLKIGKDVGIISFNDTTLKEILAGGISTISTHFEAMGSTAATLILEKQHIQIKNPFSLKIRSSI